VKPLESVSSIAAAYQYKGFRYPERERKDSEEDAGQKRFRTVKIEVVNL
jgi:hypothetical protein